ncbi:MAG: endonuclease/exonuclease/phosphatase family protein [Actinomycetia bacterium]|nr:endonuclease/exonuclease/phosphatase family protein [Actinomycetes bacterium]
MPHLSDRFRVPLLTALAVAALVFSTFTLVVRTRPVSNTFDLVLAVGSPYIALAALLAFALFALRRRIFLSIVAVLVLTASLAVQVSWYYLGRPPEVGQHVEIRILSSNLGRGLADAVSLVEFAGRNADVITVLELTPEAAERFSRAGIDDEFPYSLLVFGGISGTGVWSRYPLTALSTPKPEGVATSAARLRVPGVRFDPLLAAVHIRPPTGNDDKSVDDWRIALGGAKEELDHFARAAGPAAVIIGGDFNSTPDVRQFRDLLTDGYHDAVDQTGAGFAPTYPSNTWYPPLLVIDHVLTRNAAATSIRTVDNPGSDHRALLATIKVPLDPMAS